MALIQKLPLTRHLDFATTQEILWMSRNIVDDYFEDKPWTVEDFYRSRDNAEKFVGTYEVETDSNLDYYLFRTKFNVQKEGIVPRRLMKKHLNNFNTPVSLFGERTLLDDILKADFSFADDDRVPNEEEWKSGKISEGNRVSKIGKYLRKKMFSQDLIDFYSAQSKKSGKYYVTISDLPQHIVGMSYYAELDSWDGWNGTSCMDTRHDGSYCTALLGSLGDKTSYVAMLHANLSDLDNLENKLLARVLLREVEVDGTLCLVPTRYYGNNDTKNILGDAMKHIQAEEEIYSLKSVSSYSSEIKIDCEIGNCLINKGETGLDSNEVVSEGCVKLSKLNDCDCPMCGVYYDKNDDENEENILKPSYHIRISKEGKTLFDDYVFCPNCQKDSIEEYDLEDFYEENDGDEYREYKIKTDSDANLYHALYVEPYTSSDEGWYMDNQNSASKKMFIAVSEESILDIRKLRKEEKEKEDNEEEDNVEEDNMDLDDFPF